MRTPLPYERQKCTRFGPFTFFIQKLDAAIDLDLTVVGDRDRCAFERPRSGAFKIDSGLVESAPMAGALEFYVRCKPTGRTSEMRAYGDDRIKALAFTNDPNAFFILVFFADLADDKILWEACLEFCGRFEQHTREHEPESSDRRRQDKREKTHPSGDREEVPSADAPNARVSFRSPVLLGLAYRLRSDRWFRWRGRRRRGRCGLFDCCVSHATLLTVSDEWKFDSIEVASDLFFPFDHVDRFPWAVLCAQFAADADLFVNDDDPVYAHVSVFFGILRTRDFVQAIDRTEFDAHFTTCATLWMNYCNERRLLLFLGDRRYCGFWWSGLRSCLNIAHAGLGGVRFSFVRMLI